MGLAARGWDAEILVAGAGRREASPYEAALREEASRRGVALRQVDFPSIRQRSAWARLRRLLVDGGFELVHAHNRPQDWQLVALCRLLGVPAIYTVHRSHELTARQRALYAACARLTPVVVCVSRTVARHVETMEKVPLRKIRVIHNGIDLARFQRPSADERARVRRELGWAPDDFVWICVARLAEPKGHRFLVEAMARLRPSRSRLALAGDGALAGAIAADVARLDLGDRVQLLGSRSDVAALLGAADGYACASLTEGHPLSLLEAMAMELPVIAPRLSAVSEIASAGSLVLFGPEHGAVAPTHDPAELARAMSDVENDRDGHRRAAHGARERVGATFSLDAMLDAHERLYRETIDAASSRSFLSRIADRRFW